MEELNVFKRLGPFQFWDVEEGCRIDVDFEVLNSIWESVHLIPAQGSDTEPNKRPRVGDVVYGVESVGTASEFPEVPTCLADPCTTENQRTKPASATTSEELYVTNGPALQSKLLPNEVLEWYIKGGNKLR